MELTAVIAALEELTVPCVVNLYSDSAYVVNAFNQNWLVNWKKTVGKICFRAPVSNKDLWQRLDGRQIVIGSPGIRLKVIVTIHTIIAVMSWL